MKVHYQSWDGSGLHKDSSIIKPDDNISLKIKKESCKLDSVYSKK
jgi:hypothetical protein